MVLSRIELGVRPAHVMRLERRFMRRSAMHGTKLELQRTLSFGKSCRS